MKTKILQEIDGYKIIVGIGDAQIDGEATKPIVSEKIIDTDEYKAVKAKQDAMIPWMVQVRESLKKFHTLEAQERKDNVSRRPQKEQATYEYKQARSELETLESELKQIAPALKEKYTELMKTHAIYFKMVNAEIITDEEAENIKQLKAVAELDGFHLDTDLKQICDNRGVTVWSKSDKWTGRKITKIGDEIKSGEIIQSDLTSEQVLEIHVSQLSLSEKTAEYNKSVALLQEQAAIKKSGLIISGVSESKAATQASEWYNTELEKLNKVYGI